MREPAEKADSAAGLLPGMAVIALWMLAQCGLGLMGVFTRRLPWPALIVCVMFALAANGLLKLKRWGWAMTLGGVFLLMTYYTYMFARLHQGPALALAIPNFVFFLYLVRPEVRERLH